MQLNVSTCDGKERKVVLIVRLVSFMQFYLRPLKCLFVSDKLDVYARVTLRPLLTIDIYISSFSRTMESCRIYESPWRVNSLNSTTSPSRWCQFMNAFLCCDKTWFVLFSKRTMLSLYSFHSPLHLELSFTLWTHCHKLLYKHLLNLVRRNLHSN